MKIVTLTLNPALDKSTSVDRMIPEQKLRSAAMQIDAGGGGINVSKGIAKLGGHSTAVFPVGGHNGAFLRSLVEEAGIATATVDVTGETRENISVLETGSNLQYRFTLPGAAIGLADAQACLDQVRALQPDILVASGSLPPGLPETYFEEVAEFAKHINAKFILDTSGKPLQYAADEGLFLLKPNLGELSALSGVPELALNQVDDAALDIIHAGKCEVVVVSLGPQGALLVTRDGFEHIPAPTVKKVSTVGAGDSMVAGMVWALSNGKSYLEMVQTGVACGSAATMNTGTKLFDRERVDELLEWIRTFSSKYRMTDF
jgi:6-phosphofructokinase 2